MGRKGTTNKKADKNFNHYRGKTVVDAMQFKEMNGISLSADDIKQLKSAKDYLQKLVVY